MKRIAVGISGASGAIYGIRFLEILRELPDLESHLIVSDAAKRTIVEETGGKRAWFFGDGAGVARSYAEAVRLRRMMPLHRAGQLEDAGGYTRGTLRETDRQIAAAHHGAFAPLREFLRANC